MIFCGTGGSVATKFFDPPRALKKNPSPLDLKGGMLILMCPDNDAPRENYFGD
jgi:hypothetical protein